MRSVHVVTEDYDHYGNRKNRENYLSNLKLLFFVGLFMLIAAYFTSSSLLGFAGLLATLAGLFFVRDEISPTGRKIIGKWYPLGLIILSFAFAALKMFMFNYEDGSTPESVYSFIDLLIGGPMLIALLVLLFRGIKWVTRKK